jgi:flagellar hook-associated protein 1
MSSLMGSLQNAAQALIAHQQVIEVINHNVANANTPGYHRQEAMLAAGIPNAYSVWQGIDAGEMGSGVSVETIRRFGLDFFDARYRSQAADASRWSVESQSLAQVEATLDETGKDGLTAKMDAFWGGWQSLSVDPSNTTLKADLLQKANDLANSIQGRNAQLTQIRKDQNLEVTARVDEINTTADEIAQLNTEIAQLHGTNQQPNDLMDKRDVLLDRISQLTGARADAQPNGMVIVSIGGHALVSGSDTSKLSITQTALTATIAWKDGGTFNPSSGELAGLLDLRDHVVKDFQGNLDQLAYTLVTEVNKIHTQIVPGGIIPVPPATNNGGQNFFNPITLPPQPLPPLPPDYSGSAGLMAVNPAMNTLSNILGGTQAFPEDGEIAQQMSQLNQTAIAGLGNVSMNQYYTQKTAELGLFTRSAADFSASRSNVLKALSDQRESAQGVSLDEEAANLMRSQKAFEASSRMVTTMDSMLDKIINGMGLVGR